MLNILVGVKVNPLLKDLTPSHLSTFEDPLALCVEVVVTPQGLVEHVGTDTKLLGIELRKMADTTEIIKNNVISTACYQCRINTLHILRIAYLFFFFGGGGGGLVSVVT